MSKITSRHFTDDLAAFLHSKGVLEQAEKYTELEGLQDISIDLFPPYDLISIAFTFSKTEEGHDFWSFLNCEYQKLNQST